MSDEEEEIEEVEEEEPEEEEEVEEVEEEEEEEAEEELEVEQAEAEELEEEQAEAEVLEEELEEQQAEAEQLEVNLDIEEEEEKEEDSESDSSSSSSSSSSSDEEDHSGEEHGSGEEHEVNVIVGETHHHHHHKHKVKKDKKKKKKKSKDKVDVLYPGVPMPNYAPQPGMPMPNYAPQPGMPMSDYSPQPGMPMPPYSPQPGMPMSDYSPQPGMPMPPYSPQPGMPMPPYVPQPGMSMPPYVPQPEMAGMTVNDAYAVLDKPTVRPYENFNVEADTEALRASMKGTGTEESTIIDIISHRSNKQRQEIEKMYKTMYGKDLIEDLCSELSGHLEETVMALFKSRSYYDTWSLHKAMKGIGTDDSVLIEILATRENEEIAKINECYTEMYGKTLEEKISSETSGKYKRLLVSLCQANRNEVGEQKYQIACAQGMDAIVDREQARQDAEKLYNAGEKKFGTDESMFLQILCLRDYYQIHAINEEYYKIAGKELRDSIKSEMSGNLAKGLIAIVDSSHAPTYFAHKLKKALGGVGTDDSTLIRIIVSRSEIDLGDIKQTFQENYGKSLKDTISSDTSGDYKKILLALCG